MRDLKINKSITNRDDTILDKYLKEVDKIPMVSLEEEVSLAQRIKQGDPQALEKLCKANLRFVVSVAKQYQNRGLSLPDLINEGNLGLLKAASRFDETRGFKFISYAVWWIRQSILVAIEEQSRIIRIPLNQAALVNKIRKSKQSLEQEIKRAPLSSEIADAMQKDDKLIAFAEKINQKIIHYDDPVGEDDDVSLLDFLKNTEDLGFKTDSKLELDSLKHDIKRVLSDFSFRERHIINSYFGFGRPPATLEEIGEELSLTRERVRQIKEKIIRRIKYSQRKKLLLKYLG